MERGVTAHVSLPREEPDSAAYFRKTLANLAAAGRLNAREQVRIQEALWMLLARQVTRHTAGDSSSVPVETAQSLMTSMEFSMGTALRRAAGEEETLAQLRRADLRALLESGEALLKRRVRRAEAALSALQNEGLPANNLAYYDTVFGALPQFFRQYDRLFFAHEIPCMIDYPLCLPVDERLRGIDFIADYLARLHRETAFLCCFSRDRRDAVYAAYCPDPVEQLINLLEPVLQNAWALLLLGEEPGPLAVTDTARRRLGEALRGASARTLVLRLVHVSDAFCRAYALDARTAAYLRACAQAFAPRFARQLALEKLGGLFV